MFGPSLYITQHAVEACTTDIDYEIIASKIEVGGCYEIMDFRVNRMRELSHMTLRLCSLEKQLKKKKLTSVFPPIPRHRFYLQEYNSLYPRLNRVDILTVNFGNLTIFIVKLRDSMGRITVVQHLEQKQKRGVKSYLWVDVAKSFSSLLVEEFNPPIMIVLTSLKVKMYLDNIVLSGTGSSLFFINSDIIEVNAFKSVFANCTEALKKLPPSSKQANEAEVLQAAKKVTIEELFFLDPDLHKDDIFLCKSYVKHFDTRYDWWYSVCPNCAKQMQKDPTTGQLYKVNLGLEDETNETNLQRLVDQQQLLNEFLRLIGQKKNFHLQFGTRKNNLNTNDLLISNVSEDTTIEPTTL
ncbi:hypothetical protein DVH24_003458 [Malus domestica]|uniref:Replication factor A C-terminal domain-containing protein n=1 Tax=Malus domestica TaxID=3750 RepID=A0A498IID7_MALDO|nr:hypothetical protein DVH24_003458 [Malus domestica]